MSKHTPGPWRWMESILNDRLAARLRKPRGKLAKRDGVLLYSLKGPYNGPDEQRGDRWDYKTIMELAWSSIKGDSLSGGTPSPADRDLIAAAPDLYEACKAAEMFMDHLHEHQHLEGSHVDPVRVAIDFSGSAAAKAHDMLRSALAKAEGKPNG